MKNCNIVFEKKLSDISKLDFSQDSIDEIELKIMDLIKYITKNYTNFEFIQYFDRLLDIVTIRESNNARFVDVIIKNVYNIFAEFMNIDSFSIWGILLSKRFGKTFGIIYPAVYGLWLRVFFNRGALSAKRRDFDFPINDDVSIFEIIEEFQIYTKVLVKEFSSCHLVFQPAVANNVFNILFDFFKKEEIIKVWFPFANIGMEPLYLGYILKMFSISNNLEDKFRIYCSDPNMNILGEGLKIKSLEETIINSGNLLFEKSEAISNKKDFSFSKIKKNIIFEDEEKIREKELLKKINFVIINLDFSKNLFIDEKINRLLQRYENINENYFLIIEVITSFKLNLNQMNLSKQLSGKIIGDKFLKEVGDKFLSYILFDFSNIGQTEKKSDYSLFNLNENYLSLSEKDIKSKLKKIDLLSLNKKDLLIIAKLYSRVKKFTKSFDLIKKSFDYDYMLSYSILTHILQLSKNRKLIKQINIFINERHLKEKSFSAELIDVIDGEIDNYLSKNPDSILNDKRWL